MVDAKEELGDRQRSGSETSEGECDVHFTPVIILPEVPLVTNEEEEVQLLKVRAKLYRLDRDDENIPEWKERGTGELKMLKHPKNKTVRIVMRRDKTLKVCANHFITPMIELKLKPGHDKAFVYNVAGDFADERIKSECFAVRFATVDIANNFKKLFEESQAFLKQECVLYNGTLDEGEDEEDSEEEEGESNDKENQNPTESNELNEKMKNLDVAKEKESGD